MEKDETQAGNTELQSAEESTRESDEESDRESVNDPQNSPDQEGGGEESAGGQSFRKFIDGTVRVGATIGEAFKGVSHTVRGRQHVVMVRVNNDGLKRIDQLVESGLFKSRSESAAYLIAKGIDADKTLFGKLENTVEEINRLRDELKKTINSIQADDPDEDAGSGVPGR